MVTAAMQALVQVSYVCVHTELQGGRRAMQPLVLYVLTGERI